MALDELYAARLDRYVTAMRNGTPDRVPLRPLAAEITARYAGFTCQEVTHDYRKAFEAVIRCCRDFDWDAAVPNMVYVWTGLTQAIGLRYYGVPGIDVGPDVGFQYREPAEARRLHEARGVRRADRRPRALPLRNLAAARVHRSRAPRAQPASYRNNLSFVKGGMAMLELLPGLRPAGGAHADGVRHAVGHLRHVESAARHPGRQAARLHGPGVRPDGDSRKGAAAPARR